MAAIVKRKKTAAAELVSAMGRRKNGSHATSISAPAGQIGHLGPDVMHRVGEEKRDGNVFA